MKKAMKWASASCLALAATGATAGGLDRSNQNIGIIFEKGRYAEFSFARVMPSISGNDSAIFGGSPISGIGKDYDQLGFGFKTDLNDEWSMALYYDQPYGADVAYPASSLAFSGTRAEMGSHSLNLLARYTIDENFSVHGGLRYQTVDANVTLSGIAYGAAPLFTGKFDGDSGVGYTLGGAYEVPEIALRVALTYFSKIDHTLSTTAFGPGAPGGSVSSTSVSSPEAFNLDFQTGIAPGTLLFGQIRHAKWGDVDLVPSALGADLINLDDSTSYTIGLGRQFTEKFSGSVSISYEQADSSDLVTPLGPNNGRVGISVGGRYKIKENVTLSGGINYTRLGDAMAETAGVGRASLTDNDSVAIGFKVGFNF